jgi:hypothetical protein
VSDLVAIALIGLGCSGALGAVGFTLVRALGGRSVRGALLSVAVVSILAVVAGVVGTSQAMFLSRHDFGVVAIVSAVAGCVGLVVALLLAQGLVRDVEQVRRAARGISAAGGVAGPRDGSSCAGGRQPRGRASSRRCSRSSRCPAGA